MLLIAIAIIWFVGKCIAAAIEDERRRNTATHNGWTEYHSAFGGLRKTSSGAPLNNDEIDKFYGVKR